MNIDNQASISHACMIGSKQVEFMMIYFILNNEFSFPFEKGRFLVGKFGLNYKKYDDFIYIPNKTRETYICKRMDNDIKFKFYQLL